MTEPCELMIPAEASKSYLTKIHDVRHRRSCGDNASSVLLLKALHEYLHVQHAQESSSEAGTQGFAVFFLHSDRGIIEGQLVDGLNSIMANHDSGMSEHQRPQIRK